MQRLDERGPPAASMEPAVRNLGFVVKSLQLYPPNSPIVREALDRCLTSLKLHAGGRPVAIEVLAGSVRVEGQAVGVGSPVVGDLAQRLHRLGVARLWLDVHLSESDLQRFAEVIAGQRADVEAAGGLERVVDREALQGIRVESLQLERLFEDGAATVDEEDVWEALARTYMQLGDDEQIDWEQLASNVESLTDYVRWLLDEASRLELLSDYTEAEILRFVCENVGKIAAALEAEHANYLALAVRELFHRLDPETLVDVLAEPLVVGDLDRAGISESPPEPVSGGRGELDGGSGAETQPVPTARSIDIAAEIARSLEPMQVEELVLHTLRTRERSSTRLYGLFSRLLDGREDRRQIAGQLRDSLAPDGAEERAREGLLHKWPRLMEVLEGEAPERFVSSRYQATLTHLQLLPAAGAPKPAEHVVSRLAEMQPTVILRRKLLALVEVLDEEEDEEDRELLGRVVQVLLREIVSKDDLQTVESALSRLAEQAEDKQKDELERRCAAAALQAFFDPEHMQEMVRASLGKPQEHVDALSRIFMAGGRPIVPPLLDALAIEEDRHVRQRLVAILAEMGNDVLEEVRHRLNDGRWYFVRNLVLILGEVGDPRLAGHVIALLGHDDPRVRREALAALVKMQEGAAAGSLLAMLDDPDLDTRLLAIKMLGQIGSREAAEELREILELPNWFGQSTALIEEAAIALGRLGDTAALPALEPLQRRPWLFVRRRRPVQEAARWAVAVLRGRGPAATRRQRLKDPRAKQAARPRNFDEGGE